MACIWQNCLYKHIRLCITGKRSHKALFEVIAVRHFKLTDNIILALVIGSKKRIIASKGPKIVLSILAVISLVAAVLFLVLGPITTAANKPKGQQGSTNRYNAPNINTGSNIVLVQNETTYFKYTADRKGEYTFTFDENPRYYATYGVTDSSGSTIIPIENVTYNEYVYLLNAYQTVYLVKILLYL